MLFKENDNRGQTLVISAGGTINEDYFRKQGQEYMATMTFLGNGGSSTKKSTMITCAAEIPDGEKRVVLGYFIFVDAKATPHAPSGRPSFRIKFL